MKLELDQYNKDCCIHGSVHQKYLIDLLRATTHGHTYTYTMGCYDILVAHTATTQKRYPHVTA